MLTFDLTDIKWRLLLLLSLYNDSHSCFLQFSLNNNNDDDNNNNFYPTKRLLTCNSKGGVSSMSGHVRSLSYGATQMQLLLLSLWLLLLR